MTVFSPEDFNNLQPLYVPFNSGLHLNPSRLQAPVGSLTRVKNFEVVNGAYEETQGLTIVGPTLSEGLSDFWHADLDPSDCVITGTFSGGDLLYWYAADGVTIAGTARIYYVSIDATEVKITIDKVAGTTPRRVTSLYSTSGATLTYSGTGNTFTYQSQLGLTWEEFLGEEFLGALSAAQREQSSTWDEFKPDPLGVQGISGVFQFRDNVYAVRDFWGGKFEAGQEEPSIDDTVAVGAFSAKVAGYSLTSGSWEAGDAAGALYLYPTDTTSLDLSVLTAWDGSATITNTSTGNTLGTTLASGSRQYKNKGLLWKLDKNRRQGGWSYVDLGFSLSFDTGTVAPVATVAPLITTDSVNSISDTGDADFVSPATEYPTTGSYSAWSNLGNLDSTTPGSYASTTMVAGNYSRVLELAIPQNVVPGDARILGVEVSITAHETAGTDAVINKVQLKNSTADKQYLSANRAERDTLSTSTSAVYTYGSQLDLWELESIDLEDLNAGNYSVLVQFEDAGGAGRTINADLIQVKIYYALTGQKVYFYDGSSDVAEATLYAYQVFDGDWSTDDAEGWMTLYDISAPAAIYPGLQVRTAASGAGDLVALTRTLSRNLLPSLEEMDNAGSIYQSRRAVFSGNEDSEAVYVATGASPAFSLDKNDKFSFIRLPIDRDKDRPKYIEFHRNHLMLATGAHFLVSSIGAPNNFNTYDGATTWNPKDTITGLAAAANGTTMVACEDSIHAFTGSGATGQDAFALRIITDNSGARPYTLTNLLGNVFVDYAGITTADISDKYGGFEIGRRSSHIRTLLRGLLGTNSIDVTVGNRVVGAIPVRKKSQYRIYLADGNIITATFPDDPSQPLQFTLQNYTAYHEGNTRGYESTFVPTALDSSVLSNGDESIIMGTRLGHVMKIDPRFLEVLSYANKSSSENERRDSLASWKFFKFFDLTPLHAPDASQLVTYKSAEIYVEHSGYAALNTLSKVDYERISEVPVLGAPEDTVGVTHKVGAFSSYPGVIIDDYFTWYLDETTDGLVIRISKFGGVGSFPVRFTAMHMHAEAKGPGKNRIHKDRGYVVETAEIPQDLYFEGITGNVTFAGGVGVFTLNKTFSGITGNATFAGSTGEFNLGVALWTWDDTFTMDDDTDHTFDGST